MIDVLEIEERKKLFLLAVASADDFAYRKVDETDPSVLVTDPTISLYCLDHVSRRAIFVQVPENIDITVPPFFYLAQYEHASRLLAVSYDLFHRVAASVDLGSPPVFIHSTGRAGSTLLSKVFAEMASVTSLSEPDIYTQAAALRLNGMDPGEIQELLKSATRILLNPAFTGGSRLNVVKFRSFCIEIGDLLYRAFPDAANLFLYRNLRATIESAMRAFGIDDDVQEVDRDGLAALAAMTPLLGKELQRNVQLDGIEIPCLMWLSTIHAYAKLRRQGIPILGVRYEELIADPRSVLATILSYLNLPANWVENGLRALAHDSQAGSPLSREAAARHSLQIDSRRWDLVRELLDRYPLTDTDIPTIAVSLSEKREAARAD